MSDFGTGNSILDLLFLFILAFAGKQAYEIARTRRKMGRPIRVFAQRRRGLFLVSSISLVVLGTLYLTQNPGLVGGLYVLLGFFFVYLTFEPLYFTDQGIYFNGKLDRWEEIKRWTFVDKNRTLQISLRKNGKDLVRIYPVLPADQPAMQELIKKHRK